MAKRKGYAAEFKQAAVRLARSSTGSVSQVARDLGLDPRTLRRWCRELQHGPGARFLAQGEPNTRVSGQNREDAWREANRGAINDYNGHIEKRGSFGDRFRRF